MTERRPPPDQAERAEPTDLIRSVSRALRVLEEVSRSERPLPVKVTARRSGLGLSTAYHLVRTLCFEGYLVRAKNGDYLVGTGVAERFHDLMGSLGRPPRAQAVLQHLAATTGHTAYLARLRGGRMIITFVAEGPRSPYLEDLQAGLEVATHATALGKALLGALPAGERRRCLAENGLRPFTSSTPTDADALDAELRGLRPGTMVIERGQFRDGVSCAGAALPWRRDDARDAARDEVRDEDARWAIGVSSRGTDPPPRLLAALHLAVADLAGSDPATIG